MSNTIGERMGKKKSNGIPIKCKYCGYTWNYSGDMKMATCPSCSNKNDITENRTDMSNQN